MRLLIPCIIFIAFVSNTGFPYYNVQNWLFRIRSEKLHGLRPTERSQPVISGEIIFFGSENGYFYALKKKDGSILWRRNIKHGVSGSPTVWEDMVYFGANDGKFYCLEKGSGKVKWTYFLNYPGISRPGLSKGILYITGGDNAIYALDAKTGKWIWQYRRSFPEHLSIRGQSAASVYENFIYAGFSDGFIVKLNSLDGKAVWEKRLNDYHRFVDIDATPFVDEQSVIVSCYDGKLYSLRPSNAQILWQYPQGGTARPHFLGEKIYLPTNSGELIVISKKTGKRIWGFKGEKGVATTPVIYGKTLYFGTSKNSLYGLNLKTRKKVWEFPTGSGFSTSPIVDESGNLYFLSNAGNFYSISIVGLLL